MNQTVLSIRTTASFVRLLSADLYTILQVLSLTLFEKMLIFKLFSGTDYNLSNLEIPNQWILFE